MSRRDPYRDIELDGPGPHPSEFLTGTMGRPRGGRLGRAMRRLADKTVDAQLAKSEAELDAFAAEPPARDVLVLSVYRDDAELLSEAVAELRDSRHRVRFALGSMAARHGALAPHTVATGIAGGKFENLNTLLGAVPEHGDWTLVIDDDVRLPHGFLDRLLGLAEHYDLALAQPAHSHTSQAAWPVTRRSASALLRQSRFVEIGPVTLFRRDVLRELTPFPPLRYGWGLDVHWAAVAEERGWRLGIVDAVPVRHEQLGIAASYSSHEAIREARAFLAERPFITSAAAGKSQRLR